MRAIPTHFKLFKRVLITATMVGMFVSLASVASAQQHRRVFAWEQTTTDQALTFINAEGTQNVITINIYESDGILWDTKTVTLAGFETYAIEPGDSDANGWNLPVVSTSASGHSTPDEDAAYGMTCTAEKQFEVLGYTDEQRHAGSGYSAIWTQDALTDTWWGMWNYDGDEDKADYFFIYNPDDIEASVDIVLYKSDGTTISTNSLFVPAGNTITVYPKYDLNSNPGSDPDSNYNIGVHLSSTQPIHVSVYTQLGQDYDPSETPPWKTHDVVSGLFIPFTTDCNPSEYIWTDAKTSGQQQSAARVTNPNNFSITVTEQWYEYVDAVHYNQNAYTTNTTIPAHGTAELPRPPGMEDASGNDPRTHWRRLSADAGFHAHVSYFEQIDLPSTPKREWFWGNFKPSNTDNVFLVNPTEETVSVQIQRWKNGNVTPIAGSHVIELTARASIMAELPSEGAIPWAYGQSPIGGDSDENQTWRFYSEDPFVLHLQDWDYGDLLPMKCGEGVVEMDFGDVPDQGEGTGPGDYNTLLGDDGPRHIIFFENLRLGECIDAEADGQPDIDANGDDPVNLDDEDGVDPTQLDCLEPGTQADIEVSVTNNSGQTARLCGWVDFNGNGVFEADEGATTTVADGFSGIQILTFAVPETEVTNTYARFRISTDVDAVCSPTGFAPDGEVEDYVAVICQEEPLFDWGDAPDPPYCTLAVSGGAAHIIMPGSPFLGIADPTDDPDAEPNGQPDPLALGDDNAGTDPDDEDGVLIPLLCQGQPAAIVFEVNNAPAFVDGWIDFNANGIWGDLPVEYVVAGFFAPGVYTTGVNAPPVIVPPDAFPGVTFARFRINSFMPLPPCAVLGLDGEVEDHPVEIDECIETDIDIPTRTQLDQNYPNPFNPTTTIDFSLAKSDKVSLRVYDLAGREVAKLIDGELIAGYHSVEFDASSLTSGLYFYTLQTKDQQITRKMMLLK